MNLSLEGWDKARAFVHEHARPLERRLLSFHFHKGAAEDVFVELAKYQNPDGGFGQALEPDLRLPDSSVLATTVGLQILRELSAGEDHPLVQGAVRYLLETYDAEHAAWPIIPPNADDAPHAPWWRYKEDWDGCLANPRAEVVGYLLDYAGLVPRDLLNQLLDQVVSHAEALPDKMDQHDLLCYLRLAATRNLPDDARSRVLQKLAKAVACVVARDPSDWQQYCLKPLGVAASPDSPFAATLAKEVDLNLDYEIEHQQDDGSWAPNASWGGAFPEAWNDAEREWKGVLTVKALKAFHNFGRIE